jgi:hypothetical protein
MKFRKKPVVIEASQWLPEKCKYPHVMDDRLRIDGDNLIITTLEGEMTASPGDWIIIGVKGELYPCKPDIFEASYELVDPPEED